MIPTGYSHAAQADLVDIWVHIARDDPAAADRQIDRIEAAITNLRSFPRMGHVRDDAGLSVRLLLQDSYLVIYRYHESDARVIIERVVHGRRNLQGLID
jgi:toxin ParE1/3/4